MDNSAIIILKLNEIERKLEIMQACIADLESRSDSDNTEHLIAEKVHWLIKVLRKFLCFVYHENVSQLRYTLINSEFDSDTDDSDYETEEDKEDNEEVQ